MQLSPAAGAVRERLYRDFEFYAENTLFIRTKDQKVVPLSLNKSQRMLLDAMLNGFRKGTDSIGFASGLTVTSEGFSSAGNLELNLSNGGQVVLN
jgi:hypothetical protein